MNTQFDSFKHFEYSAWEHVAENYTSIWTSLTTQFIEPLLNNADVQADMQVLDVACGPGHVAAAAAKRGAAVVGVDFSGNMVRIAQKMHPNIHFCEGDAEGLPFPSETFDRILINFGVLHFEFPERAFAEARRLLRSGGKIGFTVWAKSNMNAGSKIMSQAVEAHADLDVQLPEGPSSYQFSDTERARQALNTAGFAADSMNFTTHAVNWRVPTAGFLFDAEKDGGVRTGGLLTRQSPERQERIRAAVEKQVEQYSTPGGYEIPMAAHIVTATAE